MTDFSILNHPVEVIRRPKRRTVQLRVCPNNKITIFVPARYTAFHIRFCLEKNVGWINKRIKKNELAPKVEKPSIISGETLYYLGDAYQLKIIKAKNHNISLNETELLIHTSYDGDLNTIHQEKRKDALIQWFRSRAEDIIEDRCHIHAEKMGVSYNNIRIKQQKTRWGSCSSKKNLNFNWTLMMTPLPVLDYVVIHECAHLIHMNHSKEFWSVVKQYCPEYKKYQKWLKDNGHLLSVLCL